MEESRPSGATMLTTSSKASNLADTGEQPIAHTEISSIKAEDLADKNEGLKSNKSPALTTSLLPPFDAGHPLVHLPTPQSPGDLVNYLSGQAGSPLSTEHSRPGHILYTTFHRPPSRLDVVGKSPQFAQLGRTTPTFTNPPVISSKEDSSQSKQNSLQEEIGFSRQLASQVATPSPEVSRTRRASIPRTGSGSQSLFTTPQPRRSSSHPYTAPISLAPAPIISPANSSHSTTYHASPNFEAEELQPSRKYDISYNMSTIGSDRRAQAGVREQGYYDPDDPFIARDDEGLGRTISRLGYASPPPKKLHEHVAAPASTLLLQNAKAGESTTEHPIAKLVMSPSEASDIPSHGSPVKNEINDRQCISSEPSASLAIDERPPSRAPISPRTPPRVSSGQASVTEPHTLTEANAVFQTPLPHSGGEMERIRQHHALAEETRIVESEKRRPDYLMRIKRARDSTDEEAAERERENALPGLGVTVSPFRGRRLKLYQPVAVASSGVVLEPANETDETNEPKTPPPISTMPSWQTAVPSISLRGIDWHTPTRGRSSPVVWTDEDECKKQKRLQAFAAPAPSGKGRRLKPAEVVGQGRVIIDVTSDESRKLAQDGILQILETPETETVEDTELSGHGAEWPDKEYPWSEQERQRDEYEEAWRRERLAWIERFLDRESESEEEESECVPGPSTWNQSFDSSSIPPPQRGHGKTISLSANPNSSRSRGLRQMTFNAANTDARQVLLSKKHVREVLERLRKRKISEDEEGIVMCICQGADDGRPMVRCDECRTWYHLICMDIHDEAELGDEWYCWKCLPSAEDPVPAPRTEPTFAPAMPESPPRAGVGDQPLYQSTLQPSPMPPSPITSRKGERSPVRRSRLPHSLLGDPGDPVRGGPSTPYHSRDTDSRLYSPPKFYDEYAMDDHAPYDPTSTPSRGLKFPNIVPITPRRQHSWTPAPPLSWMTPSGPSQTSQFSIQSGTSSSRSLAYSLSTLEDSAGPLTSPWSVDDSPVRKSRKADSSWPYSSRRLPDSPLAGRGSDHRALLPGLDESLTPLRYNRGKDTELTPRVGLSPHRE